ncbi:MAG: hypothetical protein AAF652_10915 [Cyanobacteria bacterium P01_C01_bin.72]
MKREKRIKWEPLLGIAPTVRLRNLKYELSLLILNLEDEIDESSPILTVNFSNFITFRIIDESDLLMGKYDDNNGDDYEYLIKIQKEKGYRYCWSLFIIENSHYLKLFRRRDANINLDKSIVHYLIFTVHDVIEVLVPEDSIPTARWSQSDYDTLSN